MKNTVSGYTSQFCSVTLGFPGRTEQVLCPYSMERGGLAWSPPWLYSGVCTTGLLCAGSVWLWRAARERLPGDFFSCRALGHQASVLLLAVTPLLDCDAH